MPEKSVETAGKRSRRKIILLLIGLTLLVGVCIAVRGWLLRIDVTSRDFISYWSSAKLMAGHHNPYDRAAIFRLELLHHAHFDKPLMMRNPPWALFLVLPLAWASPGTSGLVWMIAIIVCLLGSIHMMRPAGVSQIPLAMLLFAPSVICAGAEQTSIFTLLGLVLFLRWHERRPFAAGLALILAMLKPHLLVLFWVVLLLEVWRHRRWRILAGAATGLLAANALALAFDPHVWQDYIAAMGAEQLGSVFCPNISSGLRWLIARNAIWMEALPTLAGIVVAIWYWWRSRSSWKWSQQGTMIVAFSVLTAPYSWPFDQVLFLPAMLSTLPRVPKRAILLLGAADLAALALFLTHPFLETPVYMWMAPAWMAWCLYAYTRKAPQVSSSRQEELQPESA